MLNIINSYVICNNMSEHSNRSHALLSPSGAHRWMNCPGSARKEELMEDVHSQYAREGTLAHELSEIELKKYFSIISDDEYENKLSIIKNDEFYSDEMVEEVDKYIKYCISQYEGYKSNELIKQVEVSIEDKIDLTEYIEDGFGSNDFVLIAGNIGTIGGYILEVNDLKFGRGVAVSAVENEQLMLYALGAIWKHELTYDIKRVQLNIIQPRTNNISSFVISAEELKKWGLEVVKPKAEQAYAGGGELIAGEWCKFCKFKPKCKAIYEQNKKLIEDDFGNIDELSEEEILNVYKRKEQIVSWLNSIDAYLLSKLLNKQTVSGYKLVKGRTNRVFTNTDEIKKILIENKFQEKDFISEPKLLGITAIEKLVGKNNFTNLLGEYVDKTEAKPTITFETDKREDYFSSAEDDFGSINDLI